MLTFLRIETRGGNLVAVFDRGYQIPYYTHDNYDGRYASVRYDDGTFCLNEESLRQRIVNVEHDRRKCASVERAALAELLRATTNQPEQAG